MIQFSTIFFFCLGFDPQLSAYEAVLSLYEREVGPRPENMSYAKKHGSLQVENDELYSLTW